MLASIVGDLLAFVCDISIAMIFMFSYNLALVHVEALAYDSLKSAGDEEDEKFAANDMVIYDFAMSYDFMAGVTLLLIPEHMPLM